MKKNINILIGAGFSFNAGLPLVGGINSKFDRDLKNQLVRFSDSQWSWYEIQSRVGQHNGRLNSNVIVVEYVYNEIISEYKKEKGSFINYEDFYSWLSQKTSKWFNNIFVNASDVYIEQKIAQGVKEPKSFYSYEYFSQKNVKEIFHAFQFLVSGLLRTKKPIDELLILYHSFFYYLSQYDIINVFSLNHDLLLEKLLQAQGLKYSRGFSIDGSTLFNDDDTPIPAFNDSFSEVYSIYKLHGSVDFNGFVVAELDNDDYTNRRTGEIIYCIPEDIHRIRRIDPKTKDVLQNMNFEIAPNFLTGISKKDFIKNDPMYSKLYNHLSEALNKKDDLLVIGYSFGDDHINDLLKTTSAGNIININPNPNKAYPYNPNARNLGDIDELK